MPRRAHGFRLSLKPREDGALTIVYCDPSSKEVALSNGISLFVRFEKLMTLCLAVCQERAPISVRTWETEDGEELVELHRLGVALAPSKKSTVTESEVSGESVF